MSSFIINCGGGLPSSTSHRDFNHPRENRSKKSKCKLLNRLRNEPLIVVDFSNSKDIYDIFILNHASEYRRALYCGPFEFEEQEENFADLWDWLSPDWYERQVERYLDLLTQYETIANELARHRRGLK